MGSLGYAQRALGQPPLSLDKLILSVRVLDPSAAAPPYAKPAHTRLASQPAAHDDGLVGWEGGRHGNKTSAESRSHGENPRMGRPTAIVLIAQMCRALFRGLHHLEDPETCTEPLTKNPAGCSLPSFRLFSDPWDGSLG